MPTFVPRSSQTGCLRAIRACASARNTASRALENVSNTANAKTSFNLQAPLVQSGGVFLFSSLSVADCQNAVIRPKQHVDGHQHKHDQESRRCRRVRILG